MKKSIVMGAAIIAAIAMTSCGTSKESAYRKAYEKAKAQQEIAQAGGQQEVAQEEAPVVVSPVVEQPITQTTVTETETESVPVRKENLSVVDGDGLKAYSVIVGSFGVKANADGLKETLTKQGHAAQIAFNSERKVYRVIIGTFDKKADAVSKRNAVRSTYKDAWILSK